MKNTSKIIFLLLLSFCYSKQYAQKINTSQYNNVINIGSKSIFKDGVRKTYYVENGISITTFINLSNKYGKYYEVNIEIENLTGDNILFNPMNISAFLYDFETDRKTKVVTIKKQQKGVFLSSDEYIKKVGNRQAWTSALNRMANNYNAQQAGYSSSSTVTSVNGTSNSYGTLTDYYTGDQLRARSKTNISATSASKTQNYNGQAAYQAQKEANAESQALDNNLYQIKNVLYQGYLKLNTIEDRQRLVGFINLDYEKADKIEILIPVKDKFYSFTYTDRPDLEENKTVSEANEKVSDNTEINQLYKQARSKLINKEYEESYSIISDAIEMEPENIKLYQFRINLSFSFLKKETLAINDLDKIIKISPTFDNYIYRAALFMQNKNFNEAIKDANKAISLDPKNLNAYFIRAMTKSGLNDYSGSINDYEKLMEINSSIFQSNYNLGSVYNNMGYNFLQLGDNKKAIYFINKGIEILPNASYVWGSRGEYYFKNQEYKKCINDMTTAINLVEQGTTKGETSNASIPYFYRAMANIKLNNRSKDYCMDLTKASNLGNKEADSLIQQYCKD